MLIRRTCIPALTLLGALALSPFSYAGGMEAPERVIDEYTPMHITLNQAEEMHGQKNVHFFDVNPDEIWNQAHSRRHSSQSRKLASPAAKGQGRSAYFLLHE